MSGLEVDRVAEILVTLGPGERARRGSGYQVTAESVLTAAHVVRGASRVRVRFDAEQPGEWSADVTGMFQAPEIDVALLTIAPPDAAEVVPAQFGLIGIRDAVIECSAVGFPLWKLRDDPGGPYRDSAHVVGSAAVLANRREGTLEITVAPPERDPDPAVSPWQGMSGAAVFCNGRIVGIISRHHRSDGLGRLAASRVDGWRARVSSAQQEEMNARIGDRLWLRRLEDVIAPSPRALVTAAYQAQVRDIAPEQLMGRDEELAELVAFCAGPDAYQWWQGGPWAGKTALAAWFVLHPPTGVKVASFFITARLDDQSDSAAFTEAMIDQLAVIAGEPTPPGTSAAARDGLRRHLVEAAAARVRERGERLVLVVDGLDEDTGAPPGGGRASIASLLPRHPPDGVRVLVTSREQPALPADVPPMHPLRACRKRTLAAMPFVVGIEQAADGELRQCLHGGGIDREVIALITAAGGGLTAAELAELTGQLHFEVQERLGSVLGRSLYSRARYEAEEERVYLFAHETLRAAADKILQADLGSYRDKVHAWAGKYRALAWPQSTPRYLLRPYGRLLTASGDIQRLAAIAADSARHDRMLRRAGADMTALTEISAAQDLLLAETVPDLGALALLAAERYRIARRTNSIPTELPAAWARLGRAHHAADLAHSIVNPVARAYALAALASELTADPVQAADLADEAVQVARIANLPWVRLAKLILEFAMTVVSRDAGYARQLAEEIEHSITGPGWEGDELRVYIVRVRAAVGSWDIAEETADHITDIPRRVKALAEVARSLADSDPARATRLADTAESAARTLPHAQARPLADIAQIMANSDPARATRLAEEAEQTVRDRHDSNLPEFAWISEMAHVASALAEIDPAGAASLACDAERASLNLRDGTSFSKLLMRIVFTQIPVAVALAAAGLADQAEHAARAIDDRADQARALASVARALARRQPAHGARLAEDAEHVALTATRQVRDPRISASLTDALVAAGQLDRALHGARANDDPTYQPRALAMIASALATSQPQHAAYLVDEAEAAARPAQKAEPPARSEEPLQRKDGTRIIHVGRTRALAEVAQAIAASHPRRAIQLLNDAKAYAESESGTFSTISGGDALTAIAEACASTGQWEDAERIAYSLRDPDQRSRALKTIADTLAKATQWDRAEQTARAIESPEYQSSALADTAQALAGTLPDRAARLFADAEETAETVTDPGARAETQVAIAWAQRSAFANSADMEQLIRQLLCQALITRHWYKILPTLGKVAPETVVALHDWTHTHL